MLHTIACRITIVHMLLMKSGTLRVPKIGVPEQTLFGGLTSLALVGLTQVFGPTRGLHNLFENLT